MDTYFVYFMANQSNSVLYTGVTNNLERRVSEHKQGLMKGFTSKYKTHKLVYFETYSDPLSAISREKQLKKWRRSKKDYLVNLGNAEWRDLSVDWYQTEISSYAAGGDIGNMTA